MPGAADVSGHWLGYPGSLGAAVEWMAVFGSTYRTSLRLRSRAACCAVVPGATCTSSTDFDRRATPWASTASPIAAWVAVPVLGATPTSSDVSGVAPGTGGVIAAAVTADESDSVAPAAPIGMHGTSAATTAIATRRARRRGRTVRSDGGTSRSLIGAEGNPVRPAFRWRTPRQTTRNPTDSACTSIGTDRRSS